MTRDKREDELEEKAAETLKSLTESMIETPQTLANLYAALREQNKNDPQALKRLDELATNFFAKIPDLTRVVSDYSKVLETYLDYKISKRQEDATNGLLTQNETLVKHNKTLSRGTVLLAASNVVLVAVTVVLHYFP